MKFTYEPSTMREEALAVVEQANVIIADYERQGFSLTLRQLYYQFVARDLLVNTDRSYKRLGGIIVKARLAGLIDWDAIEDRTRYLRSRSYWDDAEEILRSTPDAFTVDPWEGQPRRIEVWIEKDALVGVIERVCDELAIPYFSCRGYVSWSEMYNAARRVIQRERRDGVATTILHLGDHDPSGIQMSDDIWDRLLRLWVNPDTTELKRIALNMDQVDDYGPPPNPAKLSDSRARDYVAQFGYDSWELDALEPAVLEDLIRDHVLDLRDEGLYQAAVQREIDGQDDLRQRVESIL